MQPTSNGNDIRKCREPSWIATSRGQISSNRLALGTIALLSDYHPLESIYLTHAVSFFPFFLFFFLSFFFLSCSCCHSSTVTDAGISRCYICSWKLAISSEEFIFEVKTNKNKKEQQQKRTTTKQQQQQNRQNKTNKNRQSDK